MDFRRIPLLLSSFLAISLLGLGCAATQPSPQGYPALYTSASLPQYPNAVLTDTGRQTTSLRDGLKLQLESSDPVPAIAAFYEDKIKQLGWTVPPQRVPATTQYVSTYTKGDLYFQVMIVRTQDSVSTRITISYAQK